MERTVVQIETTTAQQRFLSDFDDDWLADELGTRLRGRTFTDKQLEEFVLTETPCLQIQDRSKQAASTGARHAIDKDVSGTVSLGILRLTNRDQIVECRQRDIGRELAGDLIR